MKKRTDIKVMNANLTAEDKIRLLESTVRQERGKLFNFIKKRVNKQEDAEDILQDVLTQFVEGIDSIRDLNKTTSWLYNVARNKIIDSYRKIKTPTITPSITKNSSGEDEVLFLQDILPDFGNTPEDTYLRETIWSAIEEALDELPEDQRFVFIQNEFEDRTFKDIAAELNVPINTLLSRKRYAVLHMREKLRLLYEQL